MSAPTHEVANLIHQYLCRKKQHSPGLAELDQLVETLFFASLKREESREVTCTVALVDAGKPAGEDPDQVRPHRRSYIPLKPPVFLTAKTLAQLSQASPPWASCIAVCAKKQRFYICGFFDQEIHYRNAVNQENASWFIRPGVIQIEITGIGSLMVFDDSTLITTLNQAAVTESFWNVLNEGPIALILRKYATALEKSILHSLPKTHIDLYFGNMGTHPTQAWLKMLSRILLGVRRLKHGGALLFVPTLKSADLHIKHRLNYNRPEEVIAKRIAGAVMENAAWIEIQNYIHKSENIPPPYFAEEVAGDKDYQDAMQAEIGCVNFVAALAGVDGLILMVDGLKVRGFGVEITQRRDPPRVYAARGAQIGKGKLRQIDFTRFGTRHRSMMRYCYHHPGSIGFVISQDGDIRAMTKLPRGLILWENIRLQEVVSERERREKIYLRDPFTGTHPVPLW